jgi:hypothetical protein
MREYKTMPVQIRRADLYHYVINALERDIGGFKQALEDHAKTEGEPAPIAIHPLVDAIARSPDGAFIVAEDVAEAERDKIPMATLDDVNKLMGRLTDLEERAPPKGDYANMNERVRQLDAKLTSVGNLVDVLKQAVMFDQSSEATVPASKPASPKPTLGKR